METADSASEPEGSHQRLTVEPADRDIDPAIPATPVRRWARVRGERGFWTDQTVVLGCVLVSVAISGYLLSKPDFLFGIHSFFGHGYDDGVYFGATDNFVHGVMPYRDFTFVQPPGLPVLLAPVALLGRLIGEPDALAIARLLTLAVASTNVGLAAWIVRSRGRAAMIVAGLGVACFPLAVTADHTLRLEPYFVFLCLLAIVIGFTDGKLATPRRLLIAGGLLGIATNVKVWGAAPAIALVLCAVPNWSRVRAALIGWLSTGIVIAAPFFLMAPRAFVHDVIVDQLGRHDVIDAIPTAQRLGLLLGINTQATQADHTTVAVIVAVTICLLVLICFAVWRRRLDPLEWYLLLSSLAVVAGLMVSREFYDYYTYVTTAFLAMLLGVTVSRYKEALAGYGSRDGGRRARTWHAAGWIASAAALSLTAAVVLPFDISRAAGELNGDVGVSADIDAIIPRGSCAVTDDPIILIAANRWETTPSGCSAITDPFGLFIADDGAPPPGVQPFPASLLDSWYTAFDHAQFVVLSVQGSDFVPFTPELLSWFNAHFTLLDSQPNTFIYGAR